MIFNGIEKDYVRVHLELMRPPSPPIEFYATEKRSGGSRVRRKRFTDLILPVPVTIIGGPTVEDRNEDMTTWLIHDEPKELRFKGNSERYYLAEYESMDLDERKYRARGTINFYLAEGYRLGKTETINLTNAMQSFRIDGQVETPWKSRTTFDEPASQFVLESNLGKLTLNYEFIRGDVLVIDYKTRDITLNGRNIDVGLSLESIWFELAVGFIEMRASHETILTYTERYY